MTKNKKGLSDYIDRNPKKWSFLGTLWKYKKEIAVAVAVTASVLLFVGATHGVGALAVGVVALPQISSGAVAAYAFGTIFLAGAVGYSAKRALKSNASEKNIDDTKAPFKFSESLKKLFRVDQKTNNLYKILSEKEKEINNNSNENSTEDKINKIKKIREQNPPSAIVKNVREFKRVLQTEISKVS